MKKLQFTIPKESIVTTSMNSYFPIYTLISNKKCDEMIDKLDDNIILLFLFNCEFKTIENCIWVKTFKMSRTFSYMQELCTTLKFVLYHTNNSRLKDFIYALEKTLNNFIISIENQSFYIAFSLYRKLVEAAVWICLYNEDIDNLNLERIDKIDSYKKLIKKYVPDLSCIYEEMSMLFMFEIIVFLI